MPKEPTLNNIYLLLGKVKGEVKGINTRLDTMNGSIRDHDKRINNNESALDQQKGKSVMMTTIVATGISVIGLLIGWFNK